MFIHWGPVSLGTGKEIGWSQGADTPIDIYDNLYRRFNPMKFDAGQWVSEAKAAGMKYIVLTTKHHDGFCLWDTKQTDYNIMHSPLARDVVKELAEACKKQGMPFGVYYSICDWRHPDYPHGRPSLAGAQAECEYGSLRAFYEGPTQGDCWAENYGPMLLVWFDGESTNHFNRAGKDLYAYLHTLQPDLIVNNRVGKDRESWRTSDGHVGDYDTPEQVIGIIQVPAALGNVHDDL